MIGKTFGMTGKIPAAVEAAASKASTVHVVLRLRVRCCCCCCCCLLLCDCPSFTNTVPSLTPRVCDCVSRWQLQRQASAELMQRAVRRWKTCTLEKQRLRFRASTTYQKIYSRDADTHFCTALWLPHGCWVAHPAHITTMHSTPGFQTTTL